MKRLFLNFFITMSLLRARFQIIVRSIVLVEGSREFNILGIGWIESRQNLLYAWISFRYRFFFLFINFTVRKMIAQINAKSDWLISKKNNLKSIKLFVQIKGKLEFQASMKKIHARLNNRITERINTTLILYISFQSFQGGVHTWRDESPPSLPWEGKRATLKKQ